MNSIIHTPTPNLQKSIEFYKKLNFTILSKKNPTLVTDGKVIIEINPNKYARAGVKLYRKNWSNLIDVFQPPFKTTPIENGYLLSDPNGVWIYLMESEFVLSKDVENAKLSTLGNYGGLSIETTHIEQTISIWETLGFSKSGGDIEKGWVSYQNQDGMSVSFMTPNSCPHLFFNPSMNYFNGKNNLEIIDKIRTTGIEFTQEITEFNKEGIVDNVILRDPGGYGFFLFSD